MAYTVSIQLEKDSFYSGEALRGEMVLQSAESFSCGLSISLEWFVSGNGVTYHRQKVKSQKLFSGRYEAGEHREPFLFLTPNGPFTYRGGRFSVLWGVRALTEIAQSSDQVLSLPFYLAPSPSMSSAERYFCGPSYKKATPTPRVDLLSRLSKIGKPEISLSKQLVCPGDTVIVRLKFTAQSDLSFGNTRAVLRCEEVSPSQRELIYQNATDFVIDEEHIVIDPYRDAPKQQRRLESAKEGSTHSLVAHLLIPEDAPLTFASQAHAIECAVSFELEVVKGVDWKCELPITIRPGRLMVPEG